MRDSLLDSRQLRAFAVLARCGSFTEAARHLSISQSAVSHSIKALENRVGCRLFDRVGKNASLTQSGEQLLVHAERILAEMEKAQSEMARLSKWGRTRLRIGASATVCQYLLPTIFREFRESFPDCTISIEPGDTPLTVELLQAHRIDLGFALEPRRQENLAFVPLFEDELRFLVSPLHQWAKTGKVKESEIWQQNYILYGKGSYTSQMIDEYFRTQNRVLPTVIELGSVEAIKEMVKVGLGVSILAPWVATSELRQGLLVSLPLGPKHLVRNWGIAHIRGRRLSLSEETFIGICRTVTENLQTQVKSR
jgi:LysR family transcriptional regulator, low CO2-responsive transcriptional regulator